MGGALARAAVRALGAENVLLADHNRQLAENLAAELGCKAVTNEELAQNCGIIFLGVKPQFLKGMLADLAPTLKAKKEPFCLVSMAAGVTMCDVLTFAGGEYPIIRIMPNTPASVGCGMILYDASEKVTSEMLELFRKGMADAGILDALPEKLIDAGSAVTGCGPAFVDLFIEALADGGVACGLPRDKAMVYAAQMVLGSAKLVLESGKHPGQLKDAVCSPGGSTIQGVRALEENGFRTAAFEAVIAAYNKTKELGKA
jgi:pyrroline-5-carboxylate reductase